MTVTINFPSACTRSHDVDDPEAAPIAVQLVDGLLPVAGRATSDATGDTPFEVKVAVFHNENEIPTDPTEIPPGASDAPVDNDEYAANIPGIMEGSDDNWVVIWPVYEDNSTNPPGTFVEGRKVIRVNAMGSGGGPGGGGGLPGS